MALTIVHVLGRRGNMIALLCSSAVPRRNEICADPSRLSTIWIRHYMSRVSFAGWWGGYDSEDV